MLPWYDPTASLPPRGALAAGRARAGYAEHVEHAEQAEHATPSMAPGKAAPPLPGAPQPRNVIHAAMNATIRIRASHRPMDLATGTRMDHTEGVGSGFAVNTTSSKRDVVYALTCYHVVAGNKTVEVQHTAFGPKKFTFHVKAVLPEFDIALLCGEFDDGSKVGRLDVGDSDTLPVGADVAVIGFPLGMEGVKMARGNISGYSIEHGRVTTTAAVNPGNSGGAIIDLASGKVVGVVSSKIASIDAPNVAFATPIAVWRRFGAQMLGPGMGKVVTVPKFGFCYQKVPQFLLQKVRAAHRDVTGGVFVTTLPAHGPAARAGLRVEDIIVGITTTHDGKTIPIEHDNGYVNAQHAPWAGQAVPFKDVLGHLWADTAVAFHVVRGAAGAAGAAGAGGERIDVSVSRSDVMDRGGSKWVLTEFEEWPRITILGATLTAHVANLQLSPDPRIQAALLRIPFDAHHEDRLLVTKVFSGTEAARTEISVGDVVVSVNGQAVGTVPALVGAVGAALRSEAEVSLVVESARRRKYVMVSSAQLRREEARAAAEKLYAPHEDFLRK